MALGSSSPVSRSVPYESRLAPHSSRRLRQPTLSKRLRALEQVLPKPAFTFIGRRKILTPFGRAIHKELLHRWDGLEDALRGVALRFSDPAQITVRISARAGILDRIAPLLEFPGSLHFRESSNQNIWSDLLAQRTELGIVHELQSTPGLVALPCLGFRAPDELTQKFFEHYGISAEALAYKRAIENYPSLKALVDAGAGPPSLLPFRYFCKKLDPYPGKRFTAPSTVPRRFS